MKNKLIYMLAFLPMLLAIFLFTNVQTTEAAENIIKEVYYEKDYYTTTQLIDVKTTTSYERKSNPEYLVSKHLVEKNPKVKLNIYEYRYVRETLQRERILTTKTYQNKEIQQVNKVTVYTNGSIKRERVQNYEKVLSTYSTSSVNYTAYNVISKQYRVQLVKEYY